MYQAPNYTQILSLRLSEILADIGVNERIVTKRRNAWLLIESIQTSSLQLHDTTSSASAYFLGSKSEGTTTLGLTSDIDLLWWFNSVNVIQKFNEWKPGVSNYLMIQDETVSPGYCLLQLMRNDVPCPQTDIPDVHHFKDRSGKILLKNTIDIALSEIAFDREKSSMKTVRHGPAETLTFPYQGRDVDLVSASFCKSWPLQARQWLDQQGECRWPSDDMRRYCSNTGCCVVAVGSKGSKNEEHEWRISTSLAERCLVFSLNITQIRCYVLMKMLLKTYITPYFGDAISSFMCKTVLFQTIANTHPNVWRDSNLIICLSRCLLVLYNCVLNESCPHFIIPGNNLMAGHITHESKSDILETLQKMTQIIGISLLLVECDDLGARILQRSTYLSRIVICELISGNLSVVISQELDTQITQCLVSISNCSCSYEVAIRMLLKYIFKLNSISNPGSALDQKACTLLTPWIYTTLGSVMASRSIQQYNHISANALRWISMGLNTDVSSSKLKLASMFYCIGDCQRTENVLRDIEGNYDLDVVEPICRCHDFDTQLPRKGFNEKSDNHIEVALQYITAFCVKFLPCEINCVPYELRYEMFKFTKDDLAFRFSDNSSMHLAIVDSLPYLYFLQYKIFSYLERQDDKQRALSNLIRTIFEETSLGHRETALNLLGQCMEGEDRTNDALNCYVLSLSLRGRINAAKVHICRLISKLINDPARNQSLQKTS